MVVKISQEFSNDHKRKQGKRQLSLGVLTAYYSNGSLGAEVDQVLPDFEDKQSSRKSSLQNVH